MNSEIEDIKATVTLLATDMAASFFALTNALVAKNLLTKKEIAESAQERLLALRELLPPGTADRLTNLHTMATQLERKVGP